MKENHSSEESSESRSPFFLEGKRYCVHEYDGLLGGARTVAVVCV